MITHSLIAAVLVVTGALLAVLSLVLTARPALARSFRVPVAAISLAIVVLALWVGQLGQARLAEVKASGTRAEIEAATAHGHGSDVTVLALTVLVIVALIGVRVFGRATAIDVPSAPPTRLARVRVVQACLLLAAVGTFAAEGITVAAAMHAASLAGAA